jgi:hypothetical protein
MSVASVALTDALQGLVDARLDTIDRMLMGRMPRQERLAIVRDVESQVFELLHHREAAELTRDDVLAVLARLDPPEAYLPDDTWTVPSPVRPAARPSVTVGGPANVRKTATAAGILGIISLILALLTPLTFLLAELTESEIMFLILFGGHIAVALAAGAVAVVLSVWAKFKELWAVVGLVTGSLGIALALAAGAFVLFLFIQT